ncbi:MAG: glycosyl transferase group 1 [Frankiales bacterium]|nr:glycosyl transferase group 1 [Frankiales bacterium]
MTRAVTYVLTKHVQLSQTFVTGEIAELRRRGVRVQVVSIEEGAERDDATVYLCDLHPGRVALVASHLGLGARHPIRYARFLVDVRRMRGEMGTKPEQVPWRLLPLVVGAVRRHGSTALHAHFAWSGAAAARLLSLLTGIPWSVTLHAKDIFSKQRYLEHKLRTADRLVTVCDYNLAWMREHLGLARPVALVICGVDLPDSWESAGSAHVVTVGRLVEKKGLDTLVRAAGLIAPSVPDLRVDIIGDGAEREPLQRLVDELGLQDRVRLLGSLPHEESLARIAGAAVFCLPARIASDGDRDSMPVVIKEAMARSVPVVGSDVVAIPEMLRDGCGVLVPPDDPQALADALLELLRNPDRRAALATASRARVKERFTMQGEVAKLDRLLFGGPS